MVKDTMDYKYKGTNMTSGAIKDAMQEMKRHVLLLLRDDAKQWIKKFVPRRTHALQRSLLDSVSRTFELKGRTAGGQISSDIPYATTIKGNPKHNDTWYEHDGSYAGWYLNDPNAIKDWYNKIGPFLTERLSAHIQTCKAIYFG